MQFIKGQRVEYSFDNRIGTITGKYIDGRWQVRFDSGENLYIPEDKLYSIEDVGDMFDCFETDNFRSIDDLKRILYRYRLSGELTNIIYSMNNDATEFMPHQFVPVMKFLESYTNRLLIADEVGLGKTIESIYIWEELRARRNAKRLLIVAPAILRYKWRSDLERFFDIEAEIVSAQSSGGSLSLLEHINRAIDRPEKERFALIVSLEGIRTAEKVRTVLDENKDQFNIFDLVIIDEAHYLRNSETKSHKIGALLRDVTDSYLLLSATPIQTGSDNFYNLLSLLSEEDFYDRYQFNEQLAENRPLVNLTDAIDAKRDMETVKGYLKEVANWPSFETDKEILSINDNIESIMSSTANRIATVQKLHRKYFYDSFVTRTRKRDVIENRTERKAGTINYRLSPVAREFYDSVTQYLKKKSDKAHAFNNFSLIMRQRQMASCMPAALLSWRGSAGFGDTLDEDGYNAVASDLTNDNEVSIDRVGMPTYENISLDELTANDTKFESVLKRIKSILDKDPMEKIVIFSFFRGTVDYLYKRLNDEGINTLCLMGGMKDHEKADTINAFRDRNVNVLVSTEVGSEGIDLQFAKYEINYDLPWNPMRLEQRIGRIDRIGQKSPVVYIINAFCEDTIEDRMLSRLYTRIQVFKDIIGDIEEILGDVIQELELDVFLNDYKTDEEIERRTLQVEQAILNKRQISHDLEMQSGLSSAYQNFILSNIKSAHDNFRRLTASELIFTVKDFLNNRFPGSTVDSTRYADCVKISLSDEARDSLTRFVSATAQSAYTELETDRSGIICCFSTKNASQISDTSHKEFIDINHPLLKWILNIITKDLQNTSGCSAISISRDKLPGSMDIPNGLYSFYIQLWSADGARNLKELHYFMCSADGKVVEDEAQAENLLTMGILYGNTYDTNQIDDQTFDSLVDALNAIREKAWTDYKKFEEYHTFQNNDLVEDQERYIQKITAKKIEKYNGTINQMLMNGQKESVIRMWRGRIQRAQQDAEDRIRRLNEKFNCPITNGDVAVGIINIYGD